MGRHPRFIRAFLASWLRLIITIVLAGAMASALRKEQAMASSMSPQNGNLNVMGEMSDQFVVEWAMPTVAVLSNDQPSLKTMADSDLSATEVNTVEFKAPPIDVVVMGTGLIEINLNAVSNNGSARSIDCPMRCVLGGEATQIFRESRRRGVSTSLISIAGADPEASLLDRFLRDEDIECETGCDGGPMSLLEPLLPQTHMSVLMEGKKMSRRPSLTSHSLTPTAWKRWEQTKLSCLGPLDALDYEFAVECLTRNRGTTLVLSTGQLKDCRTLRLMRLAALTVLKRDQLPELAEGLSGIDGLRWLRARGIDNVLLTSAEGVLGYCNGWLWEAAHPTFLRDSEYGFVGGMLATLAGGHDIRNAVHLALSPEDTQVTNTMTMAVPANESPLARRGVKPWDTKLMVKGVLAGLLASCGLLAVSVWT